MKNEITAKRLSLALANSSMKPQELSDKSGVSKASISQYINGSHAPSNISSGKMASILKVNPLWLMGFDVPMVEENNLSTRDKRDIKKDLDSIMEKLTHKEYGPAAYDGEDLTEESIDLFRDELEIALKRLKLINKEKYNPNKNKK